MNILLINPITRKTYGDILRFPLGLAYISDALVKEGHQVEILDLAIKEWDIEYLETKIKRYSYIDAIGLTGLITEYRNIKEISSLFKRYFPEKPIVLGGALATSLPHKLMKNTDVDIIVSGEGEITAKGLFKVLEKGGDILNVRGVYYKRDEQLIYTGFRDYVFNLDILGYPSRKEFDVGAYFCNSPFAMFGNKRTLNIITSRGCSYHCAYCDKSLWGQNYRTRSPANMVDEIEYLIHTFGIDSIIFHDDTFNLENERVIEFCNLLIDRKIHINWLANSRPNLITLETARKMRQAGCRIIAYGIESGNQDILDSMKKNVKIKVVRETIANTWKAGIIPFAYLMIGWFNETKEQLLDTINFCVSNRIKGDFSFFTPLPNTPAFNQVKSKEDLFEEEEVLARWGNWHRQLIFNVSSISDRELISLKRYAERKIFFSDLVGNIFLYIKALGIFCFMKESIKRIIHFVLYGFRVRSEKL